MAAVSVFKLGIAVKLSGTARLLCLSRVLLAVNPSCGSKVARTRGKKVRSGMPEAVLSLIHELALFSDLDN